MAGAEGGAGQKLGEALKRCAALRDVPAFRLAEPEAEAWEALRAAVGAARREPEALDLPAREAEAMADALELLAKTWRERKVLRGRAVECLRPLLAREAWLRAAQRRQGLCEALMEPLAEQPELQARLRCPASSPATSSAEPKRPVRRHSAEVEAELTGIREMLLKGREAMRGFDWEFPRDHLGTKLDTATEAFMAFYDGLTRLGIILRDASPGGEQAGGIGCLDLGLDEGDWPGVLRFLASMYSCGSRKTYRSRIKFVAARLEELSPGFAGAAAAADGEGGARFWSTTAGAEALVQARGAEAEGSEDDDYASLSPPPEPNEESDPNGGVPEVSQSFREQFGKLAVRNALDQDLVLYVEKTQRETRLGPGMTALLEVEAECANVRINFVGFLGLTSLRTRLARVELRHQNFYSIVKNEAGKTEAVVV